MSRRALVVDDEASVASMLTIVFEAYGYTVDSARSATEAWRLLKERSYDVVVTDMKMETSTAGFDVARAARLLPNHPVIIILTAFPVLPEAWREAGADAVVIKPAEIGPFLELVEDLLAQRRERAG